MQDFFLQYAKVQSPTFEMVLFTFLLAFICSTLIAYTYYFTSPFTLKSANYIQSLILSSVIATMILQSIGDSVASGLGILGALTIINFRTSFRDPRDIIFMFAALGVGIACGSYVFLIALLGTGIFCFVALVLRYTPFHNGNHVIWELRLRLDNKAHSADIEAVLERFCLRKSVDSVRDEVNKTGENYQERTYFVVLNNESQHLELLEALNHIGIGIKRINKQSSSEQAPID